MSSSAITIEESSNQSLLPWIVTFSAALFFFYEFIQMNMFNAIDQDLMRAFAINAQQLGQLSAIYFYANVIFLIPAGIMLDRFSTKKIILAAMIICVLGTTLFASSTNYWVAYTCRFLTGIGSAFCFLSCIRIASRWFPPRKMALISGLIVTMAMVGGMIAQTPLSLLANSVGWRHALFFDAFLGVAIILAIFLFVKDYPDNAKQEQNQSSLEKLGFGTSLRMSYGKIQNWLGAIFTCMLNMPLGILGVVWGVPYLVGVHHLSTTQASLVTSMIFFGTIIGAPLIGAISDNMQRRKLPMIIGASLSLVVISVLFTLNGASFIELFALFFLLGLFTSTQVLSYPTIAESNPPILTATAVSVISFTTQGGDAVFQSWFGSLLQSHWTGTYLNQLPSYTAAAYQDAFLMIPVGFVIAIIAALLIKETNGKQQ